MHRLVESPGCAALQLTLAHAEGIDHGACFYVVSRGRIREATELWADEQVKKGRHADLPAESGLPQGPS